MVDVKGLYSYKGEEPKLLPNEIRLSDGFSRTDPNTFTDDEIIDAGFTGPYQKPDYDPKIQRLIWDSDKFEYIVEDLYEPEPIVEDIQPEPLPIMDEETFWNIVRNVRNRKLRESDWSVNTSLIDNNLTEKQREEWIEYRQKLRDFTDTLEYSEELVSIIDPKMLSDLMPKPPSSIKTY